MEKDKRRKSLNKTIHFLYDIEYIKHYNYYDELEAENGLKKNPNEVTQQPENQLHQDTDEKLNSNGVNTTKKEDGCNEKENVNQSWTDIENDDWNRKGQSFSFVRVS